MAANQRQAHTRHQRITINAPLTLPAGVQLQPTFDPIELLPPGCRERFENAAPEKRGCTCDDRSLSSRYSPPSERGTDQCREHA